MKYISERSNLELRENELFSKNKSLLRGENTQTIQYSRINKIEIFKWKIIQFLFYVLGFCFLAMGFNREENIGGGLVYIHQNDDWVKKNIIVGSIIMILLIISGVYFNSKFGKKISVYLRYNIGSKKVMRSIFTSEDLNEINNIVVEIKKKQ
jgi:hypothetical protein